MHKNTKSIKSPIIFCHYGNTFYLKYTLKSARINNPDKRIILLGDNTNRIIAKNIGVEHYLFKSFKYGSELEKFNSVYRLIQGNKHNNIRAGNDWVNFVFKRWFYVYNFVLAEGFNSFWHFDSDTMILDNLERFEAILSEYDCTEQCNGSCLNGYISNISTVFGYITKINDIFERKEYLNSVQEEFSRNNQGFAFTEMRAYEIFKTEANIKAFHLNKIIDNTNFDDCICQEHGMVMDTLPFDNKKIKKVYLNPDGRFFCKYQKKLIKMNSLNLSTMPRYIFSSVLNHSLKKKEGFTLIPKEIEMQTLASQKMPLLFKMKTLFSNIKSKVVKQ